MSGTAPTNAVTRFEKPRLPSGTPRNTAGFSERGPVRTINADALKIDDAIGFYAIADGVGSSDPSARASRFAADEAHRRFRAAMRADAGSRPELAQIVQALWPSFLKQFEAGSVPSTTLTLVSVRTGVVDYVSVGDSPVFMAMEGRAYLLTRDHTIADRGQNITSYSALKTLGGSNVLFSSVGRHKPQPVLYHPISWERGAKLVICSDGLLEVVSQDELGAICHAENSAVAVRRELLKRAAARRIPDNYSAVIINLPDPESCS